METSITQDDQMILAATRMLLEVFERGSEIVMDIEEDALKERATFAYDNPKSTGWKTLASFIAFYHETKKETDINKLRKGLDTRIDTLRISLLIGPDLFLKLQELLVKYPPKSLGGIESDTSFVEIVERLVRNVDKDYLLEKYHRYIHPADDSGTFGKVGMNHPENHLHSGTKVTGQVGSVSKFQSDVIHKLRKIVDKISSQETEHDQKIEGTFTKIGKASDAYMRSTPIGWLKRHHDETKERRILEKHGISVVPK